MSTSDFLRALETALELDPGTIQGSESLNELGWWDSMAVLVFIAVADDKLQVSVSGEQIAKCQTVPDLLALLGNKLTP